MSGIPDKHTNQFYLTTNLMTGKILSKVAVFVLTSVLWLAAGATGFAQNRSISGTVVDPQGEPIIGASVLVVGNPSLGAVTGLSGEFSMSVPGGAELNVSCIGYKTVTFTVGTQSSYKVVLESDAEFLEETVVVGYGSHKKETLTGSIVTVKGDELTKSPSPNLGASLQGRLPGLVANQRSGQPGQDDPAIKVRGFGTFGDSSPLYIIDGVEREGMTRLNPEDIESITVLKDASAAIYGARAANGVILVTTKKGQEGKARILVDFGTSFSSPTKVPEMLDAATFSEVYNEAKWYAAGRPTSNYTPAIAESDIEKYRNGSDPVLYPNTNWIKETMKPYALQTRTSIQASGGTDKLRYLLSFGARTQDGNYKNLDEYYNQYTVRANLDVDITKNLTIGANISAIISNESHSPIVGVTNFTNILIADPRLVAVYPNGLIAPGRLGENPLLQNQRGYSKTWKSPVYSTFTATYKVPFVEGLRVDASFNYDISNTKQKVFELPYWYHEYNVNTGEYEKKKGTGQSMVMLRDTYNMGSNMLYNYRITYDRTFGQHRVAAMLGQEQQISNRSSLMGYRQNFISSTIDELNVGSSAKEDQENSGSSSRTARNNFFGRFNYDFASKYLLEVLFRYDGSYKFPKETRYGFFPAASFGWRISEENFIKDNAPWINQLKLRASLGQTGNDAVSAYQYLQSYSFGGNFVFGTNTAAGVNPGTMPNPNITWEKSTKYDLGLESLFWNGLLGAEVTLFKEKRTDILARRNLSIPETFGFPSLPDENIGEVKNQGFEIVLTHRKSFADFSYNISGNISYAKNKIIFMDETPNVEEYQNQTGHPVGSSLYYQADGIFNTQEELDSYPHHKSSQVGDPKIIDLNEDGVIDSNDRFRFDYTSTPRTVFGINIGLTYKGFDLSALIQGQTGAYNYDGDFVTLGKSDLSNTFVARAKDRWTVDNPNGTMPRADCYQPGSSTIFLYDATFVRLKTVELGYTLPKSFTEKIKLSSCRFYVSGFNLLTWAKEIKWCDPEISGSSLYYPQQRVINLGVRVQF